MLKEFFEYAAGLPSDSRWLHWNMRDGNYGFAALEHRHTVLGGTPFRIPDDAKIDLPMVLKDIYGPVVVPHPRLENLVELNQLSRLGWLSGAEEAEAFQRGEYGRVDRATLKQVDLITELAERASGGSLKTKATWHDQYGTGVRGLYDALMDNPVWLLAYLASVPATLFATWLAVWQFYASRYFVPALTPSTTSRTLYA